MAFVWIISGLKLGKAPGLYCGHFGLGSGQSCGPLFWQFWAWTWARLWAFTLALGKAVGFYFGRFGPKFGQGFGPLLWQFGVWIWARLGPLFWPFWAWIWVGLRASTLGPPPMLTPRWQGLPPMLTPRWQGLPPMLTSEFPKDRRQNHKERHQSYPKDSRQNHQERHQSYPKAGRQNHQERHQSFAKTKGVDIKSSMSNTQTSNHQNHHQRSCCHIAAGSTSKEGWGTQTSNHQNSSKSSPKVLLSHCSRVNIKRRIRNTQTSNHQNHHQRSCCHIAAGSTWKEGSGTHKHQIITKGLVVTLQPGQRQKKDEEHKHRIIKIRSCCVML